MNIPSDLNNFLAEHRDSREYKRGLAVKLAFQGYLYTVISDMLDVSPGFISQWKKMYELDGIEGLYLHHKGSVRFLQPEAYEEIHTWLETQKTWSIEALKDHIEQTYGIVFQSRQSYYELFEAAGITWKKAQRMHPAKDTDAITAKKKEISQYLETWQEAIEKKELIVVYADECHLLWDDARGYVWGPAKKRIVLPMKNFRQRQTYYGVVELCSGEVTLFPHACGDGPETVVFIRALRDKYVNKRIIILWDNASYHKGKDMQEYLTEVNQDVPPSEWNVICIGFAPNAPEQNPMEDIWLKGKQFIRKHWAKCTSFSEVKKLFVQALQNTCYMFDKLRMYAPFLEMI